MLRRRSHKPPTDVTRVSGGPGSADRRLRTTSSRTPNLSLIDLAISHCSKLVDRRPRVESFVPAMSAETCDSKGRADEMVSQKAVSLLHRPKGRVDNRSEIDVVYYVEADCPGPGGQFVPPVPALMMEETVVVVIEPLSGRDDDHEPRPGLQHLVHLAQRLEIVRDVLEQVGADDCVGDLRGERNPLRVRLHQQDPWEGGVCRPKPGVDEVQTAEPGPGKLCEQVFEQVARRTADVDDQRLFAAEAEAG